MIDLHSHVLPGLDDGAADLEEALAICRAGAADGITILAATPHVRFDYPTTPEMMHSALDDLQRAAGRSLRLVPGGELDLEELNRPPDVLRQFGLAGNADYLLVETPYVGWPLYIGERLFLLRISGFTPVLAHPERNTEVQSNPELLAPLVNAGALVQITAASLDGRLGTRSRSSSKTLLERGFVHLIASDAHGPAIREIGMSRAANAVGDTDLAAWLTRDMPRAIVDGGPLPPRPERRKLFRRHKR